MPASPCDAAADYQQIEGFGRQCVEVSAHPDDYAGHCGAAQAGKNAGNRRRFALTRERSIKYDAAARKADSPWLRKGGPHARISTLA